MRASYSWKASAGTALILSAAFGQTKFEVASVKASTLRPVEAIAAGRNIGMKIDGARVDIGLMPLKFLIETAYSIKPYQLSGPDWMATERFDIEAKLPDGSTKDEVPLMLQALLAERFKLVVRRESKDESIYALLAGKDGPKLKETLPDAVISDKPFPNGFGGRLLLVKEESADGPRTYSRLNGITLFEAEKIAMPDLAFDLMHYTDAIPVVDMTGLKGYYQVALTVPGPPNGGRMAARGGDAGRPPEEASDPSPSIFASVQKLGLKLERRKAPFEQIVVEHLEKVPTEN
jgi:uncharacterized protein (TIGR03435 family)